MGRNRTRAALAVPILAATLAATLAAPLPLPASDAAPEGTRAWRDVKLCLVCHKLTYGMVWGHFDSVSMKSATIQLRLSDGPLVARFDPASLKVVGGADPDSVERSLRALCSGDDVRVEYSEGKDGQWFVREIAVKPPMQVAKEKRVSTEDVERLLAGTARYTLVDARPRTNFLEGSIATAVNVPYPDFHANVGRLPKDRGEAIVYFCAGAT